jgi:hypothetical protein
MLPWCRLCTFDGLERGSFATFRREGEGKKARAACVCVSGISPQIASQGVGWVFTSAIFLFLTTEQSR